MRVFLFFLFFSLTWNILSAERQTAEGGERLLSINTVRPFSLTAGLVRMDGRREVGGGFKTGAGVRKEKFSSNRKTPAL